MKLLLVGIACLTASVVGSTDARAETLDLRVMTFNIRNGAADDGANSWDHRQSLVFELLRAENCAVVGLQEAFRFQLDAIVSALPQYGVVGVGRDDGKERGEFAAILYQERRLRLLDGQTFWLSDTPEVIASKSWGNTITRICTWAHFEEKASGQRFYVFNVHLDHRSESSRFHAVELIAGRIAARADPDPVILLGDFNAGEETDELRFLRGEIPGPTAPRTLRSGWFDTFRALHAKTTYSGTFNRFTGFRKGPKIDYILTQPQAGYVLEAYILDWNRRGRYPSDHFPVVARLLLGRRRTA